MYDIYVVMLVIMAGLAVTDLTIGVSNDAVNFLGSAVGSRTASFRTIIIVASLGVIIGAVFSNGMMEVARKGVLFPQMFLFEEIMVIFISVMITDVIMMDTFNSLGLPTSTTVSLVFELLGAAVSISLFKVFQSLPDGGSFQSLIANIGEVDKYINQDKATLMITGILSVVFIAFFAGAIIQWIVRFIFTFRYERKLKYYGGIMGGIAFTSIIFFMILKGSKGTTLISPEGKEWIAEHTRLLLIITFVVSVAVSQIIVSVFKKNILKVVVLTGTFALAMAFAGNDLVNFIGVPLAALSSYEAWIDAGQQNIPMTALLDTAHTPVFILAGAGLIMVVTLCTSKKAKNVLKTAIDLSKYETTDEKHSPNTISRGIVRGAVALSKAVDKIIPARVNKEIDVRFDRPVIAIPQNKEFEAPAFDLVRASVNVIVPAILISIGTNSTLPLSTTYVTFMAAMGSSLADRAWGRESAVYRVSGVLTVILGWFATAFFAFVAAGTFAALVYSFGMLAIIPLLVLGVVIMTSHKIYKRVNRREEKRQRLLRTARAGQISISQVIDDSAEKIAEAFTHATEVYSGVAEGLDKHDRKVLKQACRASTELKEDIADLQNTLFYMIRSIDEKGIEASRFYILIIDYLKEINRALAYISNASFEHVDNNHKELKDTRKEALKYISTELCDIFREIEKTFLSKDFSHVSDIVSRKKALKKELSLIIERQISRIRSEELSPKNTNLFFGIILETKDLLSTATHLVELGNQFYVNKKATDVA